MYSESSHVNDNLSPDFVTTQAQPPHSNSMVSPLTVYAIALPANVPDPLPSQTSVTSLAKGLPTQVPANASRVSASLVKDALNVFSLYSSSKLTSIPVAVTVNVFALPLNAPNAETCFVLPVPEYVNATPLSVPFPLPSRTITFEPDL